MACPDELTLDLWLANALPASEAASIADHVRTCATCQAVTQAIEAFGADLHGALALDADESAYVTSLNLAATWRSAAAESDLAWGWLVLGGAVAGFVAWMVAAPLVGSAVSLALLVGVGTVVLNALLGLLLGVGQALFDFTRQPALGLTQPLLALLALAVLFWPRQLTQHRRTYP